MLHGTRLIPNKPVAIVTILLYAVSFGSALGAAPGGIYYSTWQENFWGDKVVVILKRADTDDASTKIVLPPDINTNTGTPVTFRVVKVLKGADRVKAGDFVKVVPHRDFKLDKPPHAWLAVYYVQHDRTSWWKDAVPISAIGQAYAEMVATDMPMEKRVVEYYRFWKSDDKRVSEDSRVELRRLKLDELLPLRKHIEHDLMVGRAQNLKLDSGDRELAFRLLAIVGNPMDAEWMRAVIEGPQHASRETGEVEIDYAREAIYAYLALAGNDGVAWLERGILRDPRDRRHHAAIGALCEHARSEHFLSRKRALSGLHIALAVQKPVPRLFLDLKHLKDWSAIVRIAEIGVEIASSNSLAEDRHQYELVLGYLSACPRPEAKGYLAKIKRLNTKAYETWEKQGNPKKP